MRRLALLTAVIVLSASVGPAAGQQAQPQAGSNAMGMTTAELEDEIARREEDLLRYGERLARLQAETVQVGAELTRREAELATQESQVRARIATLCRLRQGGYLHLLRGASSLSDLVRRARYARVLADHELALLGRHQTEVAELSRRRAALDATIAERRELGSRIEAYRIDLEDERRRRAEAPQLGTPFQPAAAHLWPGLEARLTDL